ncbi:MAG TPA: NAD(P)-dependent oxidoreductase [Bryobacteraceae bacterium]|nr:NAD(P)-dependent oxidoreductase [Bryobacteraceae bacterium]
MNSRELAVACIGLGRMGVGIAKNLQSSGCRFAVYNRTPEKMDPFVAAGAKAARNPREAVLEADIVVTSLMDDESVFSTLLGGDGMLAGMRAGAIHIGTSTISPSASSRIAELHTKQGSHYLAAPVLGRPGAAAAGKLMTFVSGEAQIIERARPVLECYAQNITVLGDDPAAAPSMKLVANFFGASLLEVVGEAFAFAEQRGVLQPMAALLKGFLPPMQEYIDRIAQRKYDEPGFTLDAGFKDVRLILDAAGEVHVPLPLASLIRDKCVAAQAQGFSQKDWCSFTEMARLHSGQ